MNNVKKVANQIIVAKLTKHHHGEAMGTTDQGPPEKYTNAQLSRFVDAMYNWQEAGLNPQEIFRMAPEPMKLEANYSKWTYQKE